MTAVLERPQLKDADTTDDDSNQHYVPKRILTEAMVMGTEVIALCGYKFVPYKLPDGRPVCQKCNEIWMTKNP